MAPFLGPMERPFGGPRLVRYRVLAERDGVLYVGDRTGRTERPLRLSSRRFAGARATDQRCRRTSRRLRIIRASNASRHPAGLPAAAELIAVSEHSLDGAGNLRSFFEWRRYVTRFSVKRTDDFDVSDCTILPPGDLLLLERDFRRARRSDTHSSRAALKSQRGCGGRWPFNDRGRSRLPDRQYGRHLHPRIDGRRNDHHDCIGR